MKAAVTETYVAEVNLGESSPLFTRPIKDGQTLIIDMDKLAYINSIGVKNWIVWTIRWPKDSTIIMINAPLVIISQASMVVGFAPKNAWIDSFKAPYACETCNAEAVVLVKRGTHYEYAQGTDKPMINLPQDGMCKKCNKPMEPDLIEDKHLKFLKKI